MITSKPSKAMIAAGARALPQPVARVSAYGEGSWAELRPWSENNGSAKAVWAAMLGAYREPERITAARQRLAELLDADTYDCATLHTAARDLLNALEG